MDASFMTNSTVSYKQDRHVAIIALNRPDAMNAFNHEMRSDLREAQKLTESDDDIRIVIITGSGRAFSSGTDLKEGPDLASKSGAFDNSVRDYKPIIDGISKSEKIYIAAINGYAGGVALGLSLGADLATMSENAVIASPFANIGLVPDGGASWHLFQGLGYKRAFSAIAESTPLSAQTCLEIGLVNKIFPDKNLIDESLKWAHELSLRSPLSLCYTKKLLRAAPTLSQEQAALLESEYQMICANSEDSAEAIAAFISKKKPVFKGQ